MNCGQSLLCTSLKADIFVSFPPPLFVKLLPHLLVLLLHVGTLDLLVTLGASQNNNNWRGCSTNWCGGCNNQGHGDGYDRGNSRRLQGVTIAKSQHSFSSRAQNSSTTCASPIFSSCGSFILPHPLFLLMVFPHLFMLMHPPLPPKSQVVFQLCFSLGHTTIYCPHYFPTITQANNPLGLTVLTSFQSSEANEALWYLDSAISSHMSPLKGIFLCKLSYNGSNSVIISDGTCLPIGNVGQVHLSTCALSLKLSNVKHVPN